MAEESSLNKKEIIVDRSLDTPGRANTVRKNVDNYNTDVALSMCRRNTEDKCIVNGEVEGGTGGQDFYTSLELVK